MFIERREIRSCINLLAPALPDSRDVKWRNFIVFPSSAFEYFIPHENSSLKWHYRFDFCKWRKFQFITRVRPSLRELIDKQKKWAIWRALLNILIVLTALWCNCWMRKFFLPQTTLCPELPPKFPSSAESAYAFRSSLSMSSQSLFKASVEMFTSLHSTLMKRQTPYESESISTLKISQAMWLCQSNQVDSCWGHQKIIVPDSLATLRTMF